VFFHFEKNKYKLEKDFQIAQVYSIFPKFRILLPKFTAMQKHFNLNIRGKVQGVWYRYYTRETAQKLGLKGFVRNEKDGSVHAEAEGEEEALTALVEWCKTGPKLARVESVDVKEAEIQGFSDFEIG